MRTVVSVVFCLIVLTPVWAGPGKALSRPTDGEPFYEYVANEVLVKFVPGTATAQMTDAVAQIGGHIEQWSDALDYYRVTLPASVEVIDAVRFFRSSPQVEWANFNYIAHTLFTPNDPFYSLQWHYPRINLPQAWDITRGAPNIVVAVCDMGFQFNHPDWAGVQTVAPRDLVDADNDPSTTVDDSHGMHVGGTIFAATDNGVGVAGVAAQCTLMPIRVMDDSGSGTAQNIADGILWASSHGAELLNLSLGFGVSGPPQDPGPPVSDAIAAAAQNGVVIFAASGNDGQPYVGYPAAYEPCISVGSTAYDDARAPYSNYGSELDIVAPGGDMTQDLNNDGYADGVLSTVSHNGNWAYVFFQGTSMACPHACGVGALLMAHGLAGNQVRTALQQTVVDLGAAGWDTQYGYGRINAYAALQWQAGGGEVTLLNEPFETFPLVGWQVTENGGDGVGWQTLAGTTPDCGADPHSGNNAVWHDDESGVGPQDDWLITPSIAIPAGASSVTLRFWQRNCFVANYYEYHALLYSVNGGNWTEATQFNQVQVAWDQIALDATVLAGSNVRFAWRYQGTYATEWFLDDVTLTAVVPGAITPGRPEIPQDVSLLEPYPNPFNSVAQIPFELPADARIDLSIYNVLGQKVATLASGMFTAGTHRLNWNAANAASGLYLVKLTTGTTVQTQKLLLVR